MSRGVGAQGLGMIHGGLSLWGSSARHPQSRRIARECRNPARWCVRGRSWASFRAMYIPVTWHTPRPPPQSLSVSLCTVGTPGTGTWLCWINLDVCVDTFTFVGPGLRARYGSSSHGGPVGRSVVRLGGLARSALGSPLWAGFRGFSKSIFWGSLELWATPSLPKQSRSLSQVELVGSGHWSQLLPEGPV